MTDVAALLPVETGRWCRLRPLDPGRLDSRGNPADLVDLFNIYATTENEYRLGEGVGMTPERMKNAIESPATLVQRVICPKDFDDVWGHLVAYNPDFRNGNVWLAMVRHPAHPFAVEGVALFLDRLFEEFDFDVVFMEAADWNVDQFLGHVVKDVVGEGVPLYGYYKRGGERYAKWFFSLPRYVWKASGYAHGGYLTRLKGEE